MRKTLIGAIASSLLLVGIAGPALAQEDTGTDTTDTTDTTQTDTTQTDTTQTDTTQTDTTQTDTTGTDTTQTDTTGTEQTDTTGTETGSTTTGTDTTQTDTTQTDATDTDTAMSETATSATNAGDTGIAESFATEAPNPQPGAPVVLADDAAPPTGDQVLGESQLAFTGPDVRVMALAGLLLGAGALFVVASRRQEDNMAIVDTWLE